MVDLKLKLQAPSPYYGKGAMCAVHLLQKNTMVVYFSYEILPVLRIHAWWQPLLHCSHLYPFSHTDTVLFLVAMFSQLWVPNSIAFYTRSIGHFFYNFKSIIQLTDVYHPISTNPTPLCMVFNDVYLQTWVTSISTPQIQYAFHGNTAPVNTVSLHSLDLSHSYTSYSINILTTVINYIFYEFWKGINHKSSALLCHIFGFQKNFYEYRYVYRGLLKFWKKNFMNIDMFKSGSEILIIVLTK